jgi:hypothetical protein
MKSNQIVAMYVTAINGRHFVVIQSSVFFSAAVCAIVLAPSALLY